MRMTISGEQIQLRSLENHCPRDGEIMTKTVCEQTIIRTCARCGYECKTIDGETKLRWTQAFGTFGDRPHPSTTQR